MDTSDATRLAVALAQFKPVGLSGPSYLLGRGNEAASDWKEGAPLLDEARELHQTLEFGQDIRVKRSKANG